MMRNPDPPVDVSHRQVTIYLFVVLLIISYFLIGCIFYSRVKKHSTLWKYIDYTWKWEVLNSSDCGLACRRSLGTELATGNQSQRQFSWMNWNGNVFYGIKNNHLLHRILNKETISYVTFYFFLYYSKLKAWKILINMK